MPQGIIFERKLDYNSSRYVIDLLYDHGHGQGIYPFWTPKFTIQNRLETFKAYPTLADHFQLFVRDSNKGIEFLFQYHRLRFFHLLGGRI